MAPISVPSGNDTAKKYSLVSFWFAMRASAFSRMNLQSVNAVHWLTATVSLSLASFE